MGNINNIINSPGSGVFPFPSGFNPSQIVLIPTNGSNTNVTLNGVYTVVTLNPAATIAGATLTLVPTNGTSFVNGEIVVVNLGNVANDVTALTIASNPATTLTGFTNPSALPSGTDALRLQYFSATNSFVLV